MAESGFGRGFVVPLAVAVAMWSLLAGCSDDADTSDVARPDEAAAHVDLLPERVEAVVTPIEFDLPLPMPDEVLFVRAVDHVDGYWRLLTIYETRADGRRAVAWLTTPGNEDSWEPLAFDPPEGYAVSTAPYVSTSDQSLVITSIETTDGQVHSAVWRMNGSNVDLLGAVQGDGDTFVRDVFAVDGGLVAVGWVVKPDGNRPTLWIQADNGWNEIQTSLDIAHGQFTTGAHFGGDVWIFGNDLEETSPFVLRGATVAQLSAAEPPTRAMSLRTALVAAGQLWIGGSSRAAFSGRQAIWSYDGNGGWSDRTLSFRGSRSDASGAVHRLGSDRGPDGHVVIWVADGRDTWWTSWTDDGGSLVNQGWLGGHLGAYIGGPTNTNLAFHPPSGAMWRNWDEEVGETSLPPDASTVSIPYLGSYVTTADGTILVARAGSESRGSSAITIDGTSVGEPLEGVAHLYALQDGRVLVAGNGPDEDGVQRPLLRILEDRRLETVDLPPPEGASTGRLVAVLELGDGEVVVAGHWFRAGRTSPRPLAYRSSDLVAWELLETEGLPGDRGLLLPCGPNAAATYTQHRDRGIAFLTASGWTHVDLADDIPGADVFACQQVGSTVWAFGRDGAVAVTPDGTITQRLDTGRISNIFGTAVLEVDGTEYLVAAVRRPDRRTSLEFIARPSEGSSDFEVVGALDTPLDVTVGTVRTVPGRLILTGLDGLVPIAWEIELRTR